MSAPVAVVGGATSGLGAASARALASRGMDLLLWSRSGDRLAATAEALGAAGRRVETVVADAGDPSAAAVVADAVAARFGRADVLVLNAGGPPVATADQVTPDGLRSAFQLLAITPIDLTVRLLPLLRAAQHPRVVAILSSGVREPIPNLAYSNTGRSALLAWLKTLATQVAADGITVNGVVPGRIATPRVESLDQAAADRTGRDVAAVASASASAIPAGRYGDPDELGALVGFLAAPEAAYITGSAIAVDGGALRSLG